MRILVYGDLNHGQLQAVWRCRDLLQTQYGISLFHVSEPGNAAVTDLLLIHTATDGWDEALKMASIPVVILERIDGPQLSADVRKHIGHTNVRAVIKNTIYSAYEYYNQGPWRRHEEWCRASTNGREAEFFTYPEGEWITPDEYRKLCIGFSFAAYPHMDEVRNLEPYELSLPRLYTCHFAGTADYGQEMDWLNWHRMQAVAAVEKLGRGPNIAFYGRKMQFPEYFSTMRQAEFVVSPWGLGEPCYRDFEAVLSGCMVIKPDTRHILTNPAQFYRIPQIERCICKPDFSDLAEIVENVRRVPIGDRIQWARHVAESNGTPAITRRLAMIFKGCLRV